MIRRLLPRPLLTATLALVWLLLVNRLAPGQVLLGLVLGVLIPHLTRRFQPEPVRLRRPLTLLRLGARVLADLVLANLTVARLILRGPTGLRPGFVAVPLDLHSAFAISLLANAISLTPGTVSARLSADRRTLLVHALDLDDPAALVATIKARYEAPLREVFEPC